VTVAALKDWMAARGNPWAQAFVEIPRVRVAVDQAMARPDTPLRRAPRWRSFRRSPGGSVVRIQHEQLDVNAELARLRADRASARLPASSAWCAISTTVTRSRR